MGVVCFCTLQENPFECSVFDCGMTIRRYNNLEERVGQPYDRYMKQVILSLSFHVCIQRRLSLCFLMRFIHCSASSCSTCHRESTWKTSTTLKQTGSKSEMLCTKIISTIDGWKLLNVYCTTRTRYGCMRCKKCRDFLLFIFCNLSLFWYLLQKALYEIIFEAPLEEWDVNFERFGRMMMENYQIDD